MLTIKQINEDKEAVIRGLEKKHFAGAREAIEAVLNIDGKRKSAQAELKQPRKSAYNSSTPSRTCLMTSFPREWVLMTTSL